MEIRSFAERVLFSNSLYEKLARPESTLTDHEPGEQMKTPAAPGRPVDLRLRENRKRVPFPRPSELGQPEARGRLLHFFANHELLAAELMALVLLKFPEAPKAFRRGVARTMQEEQEHTRLYLERMNACGVPFGSLPVNDFFWKSIAPMETPLDYVTRLSLTFEQANLDYSRHFAQVFAEIGDLNTAALLDRIYRDEIGHVGYGLRWFRRWKQAGERDWDSFREQLHFPLSPSRAKGAGIFNREGRLRAGLDATFIDALEVFGQSKGRPPDVYWFNPQAEWMIAQSGGSGMNATPDRRMMNLARDLSGLSVFLARRDDVALVDPMPSVAFLQKLIRQGFRLPEIQSLDTLPELKERKLGELRPWAWSPDVMVTLRSLLPNATNEHHWSASWRELHSKAFSQELLELLFKDSGESEPWIRSEDRGRVCREYSEVESELAAQTRTLVLKSALGLAGRGNRRVLAGRCDSNQAVWVESVLAREGAIVVQPWLSRVMDFSLQYHVRKGGGMDLLGWTRLHNSEAGSFRACSMERNLPQGLSPEVRRYFYHHRQRLTEFYEQTFPETVGPILSRLGFSGPLGVDAFIYADEEGKLRINPIVEINPRTTMGRVTLELARYVAKGERVIFEVLTTRFLKASPYASWQELATEWEAMCPVVLERTGWRTWLRRGTVILSDPSNAEACLAVMRVGDMGWVTS